MPPYKVSVEKPRFKALIYGDAGTGKTTFAASAQDHPDMGDVLFINIEGGLLSVASRGDLLAEDAITTQKVEEILYALKARAEGYESVRTVVVDSATELQTINLEEVVRAEFERGKNKNRINIDDIWQEDYGQSTTQLKRLFRGFKDLPINVIFTCLAKYVYPKGANTGPGTEVPPLAVLPSLTQKLGESLMGYVDFVWYAYRDGEDLKDFCLLTQPSGQFRAKTRGKHFAEVIGPVITNGSLPEVYETFVAAETVDRTPKAARKGRAAAAEAPASTATEQES